MASLKHLILLIIFALTSVVNSCGPTEYLKTSPKLNSKAVVQKGFLVATNQLGNIESVLFRNLKHNPNLFKDKSDETADSNNPETQYFISSYVFLIADTLDQSGLLKPYYLINLKFKSSTALSRAPPQIS